MTATEDDEMTELVDADFPRVDLVGKGANGIPRFLIAKQDEGGLLDPGFVRELIGKQAGPAQPQSGRERVEMTNGVTLNGSPAALMEFIHQASVRKATEPPAAVEVAKEKYSADDKRKMLAAGHAIKNENGDPAYPIGDKDDLGKAVRAVGRGGPDHDRIRAYVIRRAKALGGSSEIPDAWNPDGSLKQKVSKDMADLGPELDDGIDGMDPTVPLAEPDEMGPGNPTEPGSPAWESIDAATAQKWTSILARARVAVDLLAEREMLEAASGDTDDGEKACDLQDVCCAIDYAISVLAPFAVSEQSAADCGTAEMEAIGKAMAAFDAAPLATVEGFAAIAKSGRVLSAANEAHIRDAAQALNTVLSSLPKAPAAEDGMPVAKMTPAEEAGMPEAKPSEAVTAASGQQPVMGTSEAPAAAQDAAVAKAAEGTPDLAGEPQAAPVAKSALTLVFSRDRTLVGVTDTAAVVTQVAKADGDGEKKAMQAVFDQDGDLIGIVDPDAIQPVTGAGGKPAADDSADGSSDAAAADDSDLTPQPPAEAGTPAGAVPDDDVAKQDGTLTVTQEVLKSIISDAVTVALGAHAPAEDIAKQADVSGLREKVEALVAEIEVLKEQPAPPKVFTNGQTPPPAHQLRGQDQGVPPQIDVAKAREMKQRMYTADPAEANRIRDELNQSAIATLDVIHGRR